MIRRKLPTYNPATDTSLFYWLDASDTNTLKGSGGTAITNGATVYEWYSKAASVDKFVQSGTYARPTWSQNAFKGRPGVVFNGSQVLGATVKNVFNDISGMTLVIVAVPTAVQQQWGGRPFHIAGNSTPTLIYNAFNGNAWPNSVISIGATNGVTITGYNDTHMYVTQPYAIDDISVHSAIMNFQDSWMIGYINGKKLNISPWINAGTWKQTVYTITVGAQHFTGGLVWGLNGVVFEVLLWRKTLTEHELAIVHEYIEHKWQINKLKPLISSIDQYDQLVWLCDEEPGSTVIKSLGQLSEYGDLTTLTGDLSFKKVDIRNRCANFTQGLSIADRAIGVDGLNTPKVTGNQISISAWIYITQYRSSLQYIVGKQYNKATWTAGTYSSCRLILRNTGNGAWGFEIRNQAGTMTTSYSTSTTNVPLNKWTLLSATWNGSTIQKYTNGLSAGNMSFSGTSLGYTNNENEGPWALGGVPYYYSGGINVGTDRFYGYIADVRVANTVRSQSYYRDMYRAGIGIKHKQVS